MIFGLFGNNKPQQETLASSALDDLEDELPDIDSIGLDDDDLDLDDDDLDDDDVLDVDFEEI